MNIETITQSSCDKKTNILVVALDETKKLNDIQQTVNQKVENAIEEFVFAKENFIPKFGKFYTLTTPKCDCFNKLLLVGIGTKEDFLNDKARILSAKIIKQLMNMDNNKNITIAIESFIPDDENKLQAFTEGLEIGYYAFDKYKKRNENEKIDNLRYLVDEKNIDKTKNVLTKAKIISDSINFARNLVNDQPNVVTPEFIAQKAKEIDTEAMVFEKEDIEKMEMGAFLAVAKGSVQKPKFIHLKYSSENPTKKIALVGKSITFDSGGLDIKPPASMLNMKDDMSGSASVLAIMKAIKALKPNIEVHAIIASCENMPGCAAYKPGDILIAKNKKTIEVDNTDAEGRLTLADALCYAEELKVDEIIDMATLTGACMVALGSAASGIMGNNKELIQKIITSGNNTGEKFWELPMFEEYKDSLKSDIADMKNTGSRYGGASTAAVFLNNFIKDTPWVHIDIAGTAFLEKSQNEYSKGATGVCVRTIVDYITSL